jgi:hypothetical protein
MCSAFLKFDDIISSPDPSLSSNLVDYTLVISSAIGAIMLLAWSHPWSARIAAGFFIAGCIYHLWSIAYPGNPCHCFGTHIEISHSAMLVLDGLLALLLLCCAQIQYRCSYLQVISRATTICILCAIIAWIVHEKKPPEIDNIAGLLNLSEAKLAKHGNWLVVGYRTTCTACMHEIPDLIDIAGSDASPPDWNFLFINLQGELPYANQGHAHHITTRAHSVETPIYVVVRDGKMQQISHHLPSPWLADEDLNPAKQSK